LAERRHITAGDLDAVAPENPVGGVIYDPVELLTGKSLKGHAPAEPTALPILAHVITM
jgi:hypothetical protein